MEQHLPIHDNTNTTAEALLEEQRYKTLGVRLDENLHAQLSFIAQLTGSSLADEIRRSIEARVSAAQDDPDLVARAEALRAEIDREAQARRQAISGFFGKLAVDAATEKPSTTTQRGRRNSTQRGETPGPTTA